MCIAHVMRSKIWYLYDMMFYANVFCTLSSEIHFKTCLPGLCLMFCTFCASVQVYLEGCLQSLWFIQFSFSNLFQFSNSLQDRQNIRNFSLPKLTKDIKSFFSLPSAEMKRCHSTWPLSNERKGCYHLEKRTEQRAKSVVPDNALCVSMSLSSLGNN